jgi:hypothetical protein
MDYLLTLGTVNDCILAEKVRELEKEKICLRVARRDLDAQPAGCFQPVKGQRYVKSKHAIKVKGLTSIDGQYIILASDKKLSRATCRQESTEQGECGAKPLDGNTSPVCSSQRTEPTSSVLTTASFVSSPTSVSLAASEAWITKEQLVASFLLPSILGYLLLLL